jgi:hypothetical protein
MVDDIQGLWIGPRLTAFERLAIQSFLDHGHPFRLFVYNEVQGVPEGATLEDANGILEESLSFPFREPGRSLAHFADWFRWELLFQRGGYWVDLDVVCLRPFRFTEPVVFGYQDPETPSVGVLRFPPGHPFLDRMIERCINPHVIRPHDSWRRRMRKRFRTLRRASRAELFWGEAGGPRGLREELPGSGLERFGTPYTVFYPVHHQHWKCIYDDTLRRDLEFFADTHAIHLWNEVFRQYANRPQDGAFHPDSVFEQLKRRHLGNEG